MRTTPSGAVPACTLDACLSGATPAPTRQESPFCLLDLAVASRCPRDIPRRRDVARFGGDHTVLALWRAAWRIAYCVRGEEWRAPIRANTTRIQLVALLDTCERRLEELDARFDIDPDDIEDVVGVRAEYEMLAGAAAGCLAEMGDAMGRSYCRERAAWKVEHGQEGHAFAAALIGLTADVRWTWRPGNPGLGAIAAALETGQALIRDAARGTAPEPEDEPSTAKEILAKAVAAKAARDRALQGPSLLVVATVSHLPGGAEDGARPTGKSTGTTARSEWAPYAGKRWPLVPVPDLAAARAELVGEFPYAEALIDAVLHDLAGRPHVLVRPLLLVGGPGSGKTRFARRLAEVLGLGWQVHGCAGQADASILSTSRQWSTGRATVMLQMLRRLQMACGLLVLDEIDKTGTGTQNGSLLDGILPLLTDDARRFFDTFLETVTDLSAVSYVATANDLTALRRSHPALLDRFRVFEMPAPRPQDLPVVLRTILADIRAERGIDEAWCPDCTPEEVSLVEAHYRGGSLRLVRRLAETLVAGRDALATRM